MRGVDPRCVVPSAWRCRGVAHSPCVCVRKMREKATVSATFPAATHTSHTRARATARHIQHTQDALGMCARCTWWVRECDYTNGAVVVVCMGVVDSAWGLWGGLAVKEEDIVCM